MVQNEINRYYALTNTQSVHNTLKVTLSSFYLVSPLVTTMYSIINKWRNIKLALGINAWPGTAIKFRDKTTSGSVPCEYSCHGMKKKVFLFGGSIQSSCNTFATSLWDKRTIVVTRVRTMAWSRSTIFLHFGVLWWL